MSYSILIDPRQIQIGYHKCCQAHEGEYVHDVEGNFLRRHLAVSIILLMVLLESAMSENDYVDQVDLGNSLSENTHNVIGRGWAESPQFNPYKSPSGDNSKRYMTIGEDCSLDMHIRELNVPYTLNFEVEDGNCDDSFRVLVDGKEIYVFTGQNKGTNNVETKLHYATLPKEYAINPTLRIAFKNTACDNCGKAAVYNVGVIKGTLGQSLRGAIPEPPNDFFIWRDQALVWANNQKDSLNWVGWCLNFVACAFEQNDKGTAGWETALLAANNLQLFNQETDGWKSAPVGALIFFDKTDKNEAGHVGIYTGNGEITEAYGAVKTGTKIGVMNRAGVGSYIGWAYPPESWKPTNITPTTLLAVSPESDEYDEQDSEINDVESWCQEGRNLLSHEKFDEAIKCFDKAIEIDQRNYESWRLRGLCLLLMGKYEESIQAYDKAIELDPDSRIAADLWRSKGEALDDLGKHDEAIQAYDKAIELDPDSVTAAYAWRSKGDALDDLGKHDEAIQAYDKAIELYSERQIPSDPNLWMGKGKSLSNIGKNDEAIHAFEKAIQACDEEITQHPNQAWLWNEKGDALEALGRAAEANDAFAKAKELGYNS